MSNLRRSTYRLYQSALTLVCFGFFSFASMQTVAKPQLVTPQLPPAIQGQAYAASLVVGSAVPLANAGVAGLPPGLSFAHNGSGSIAISGTPTIAGTFALNIIATDNVAGALNTTVVLTVYRVATNATGVSAGDRHSCAVVNGGVQCWGLNSDGQLGNNSTTSSLVPVQAIAAGSNVTSVSAGFLNHSCAVVSGGAQCWGANSNGQLGNNSTTNLSLVPVQAIAAGSNVTAISAGQLHSCAVVNGGVQCWGYNTYGQLGNNSTARSLLPVQVIAAGSNVTAVSAGGGHSCAVVNGGVQCWGAYTVGLLFTYSSPGSLVPVQAIAPGSNVTAVSAGGRMVFSSLRTAPPTFNGHTCAVVNSGLQCWGANSNGQLGNNSVTESLVPVQAIAAGSNVTAISAGDRHGCAVVNGGMQCWGDNTFGMLGNNSTTSSLVPVQAIAAGSNVTSVAAGGSSSCAVVKDRVQCWGLNTNGQLGNNIVARSLVPVQAIAAGSSVTSVSAGGSTFSGHSCAVVNGGAQCWGSNGNGKLGNNSVTDSLVPVQAIAAGSIVTRVSAGSHHSCAVVNGGVQCWGDNSAGQLGNNSVTESRGPVQAIAAGSNATAISAGQFHSCAVVNGGVQCWGANFYGMLGNNSVTQSPVPVQAIAAGSNAAAISAGQFHSCAVVNGGVQCWGDNTSVGMLGNNSTSQSLVPVQAIAAGSNVTTVSAGAGHSCAVVNGGVQCWGNNIQGQLGNNSTTRSLVPVQAIAANSNVTTVSAGGSYSCAMANGGVQCWGFPGQLGNNSTPQSLVPVQTIAAGSNVTAVVAGGSHSCAVVNGGAVCWGDNSSGQLADANSSPVALSPVTTLIKSTSTPISQPFALYSNNTIAGYADALTISAAVGGNDQTGTVTFSVATHNGLIVLPGCEAVNLIAGSASCTVAGSYQIKNPGFFQATYSGDTFNLPTSANLSQVIASTSAVLSVVATPLPPIPIGRTTTLTALVKMNNPAGLVTFSDNGVPILGCAQVTLSLLPNATDAAVATCTVTVPASASASGNKQYVATYFYPAGHASGKVNEQAIFDLRVVAQATTDYTDMWWAGTSENGWGMSITQHGPIQFNVIFAYDNSGKSIWYVMPGGSFNAAGTVFTGPLYLPTSSPFSAYDKTKFVIGAQVGSAAITYTSGGTANLVYNINGVTGSKSIQRQIFASETSGPNLRTNDLWWATAAEDGWGINIAQQGRVLFPIWYTYDAAGKATFFTALGGSWNGTVWSGTIYSHASSPWLGVTYNPGAFTATNVGAISLDFNDASNATMTTTVNGFTQVRHIERQPY